MTRGWVPFSFMKLKPKDGEVLWVMKAPVISTGHVRKEDLDILRDNELGMDYSEGYVVNVTCREMYEDLSFSIECMALIDAAREDGYTHLRFDSDGDYLDGYPTFDW